jgi:hypothetical protein
MLNFYLYSISSVSLTAFYIATLVAIGNLLSLLLGVNTGVSTRGNIAGGLGFALVSLPVWWLHWRWLRNQFAQAAGAAVNWHRFYLFTIVCLNAIAMLFSGGLGITALARLGLRASGDTGATFAQAGLYLSCLGLSAGLWLHHWRQFRGEMGELQTEMAQTT